MFCICLTFAGDDPYSSSTQYKEEKTAGISDAYMGLRSFFLYLLKKIQKITERSVFFTTIPTGLTHAEEKKKRKVSALEESMETSAQQPGAQAPFSGGQRGFLPIDGDERAHYHTS